MKNIHMPRIFQPWCCDDLIRLGKDNDGGYIINKLDVLKSDELISFGIGEDNSFETNFNEIKRVRLSSFDESVKEVEGYHHSSINVDSSNIESILKEKNNVFLKCDIDGGEYEILKYLIENSFRFIGAAFEFHGLTNYDNFDRLTNFISKFELRLVHVHINNYSYAVSGNDYVPDVVELSFSSSKENSKLGFVSLPNKLDMPNNPDDEEFKIFFNGDI
jgi:FkbM family methyltransferase